MRSDGAQAIFYQNQQGIMVPSICNTIKKIFRQEFWDDRLNQTLVTLILKVNILEHINQFKSMSLLNISYKIVTKFGEPSETLFDYIV